MKIEILREDLIPALSGVAAVVERRQTLPILSNLLIETSDKGILLKATDLELQISSLVSGDVIDEGAITVPAKKFSDICRALPEGSRILLDVGESRATIRAGKARYQLSTLPAEDYPGLESNLGERVLNVDSDVLLRMIERTSFAMAHQDVRYYLNGLLLEIGDGKLISVATDGHRLAKSEVEFAGSAGWEGQSQFILPAKTVGELKRLVGGKEKGIVKLQLGERGAGASLGETILTTKLIDGRYPDYSRVIPAHLEETAVINRELLRDALTRTAVLSYEKQKGVRMTFETGLLKLEVSNPEHEQAEEEIPIEYAGKKTMIGFNVGYWIDVLNVIDGEELEVRFLDSDVSAVVSDPVCPGDIYVVMPMRI
jgi:DNA polymerase-3 subunit beta